MLRVSSPSLPWRDAGCVAWKVAADRTLEIRESLVEIAQRPEVVQSRIEQDSLVVDQALEIHAVRLVRHARNREGVLRLRKDRRSQQGGPFLGGFDTNKCLLHGESNAVF